MSSLKLLEQLSPDFTWGLLLKGYNIANLYKSLFLVVEQDGQFCNDFFFISDAPEISWRWEATADVPVYAKFV